MSWDPFWSRISVPWLRPASVMLAYSHQPERVFFEFCFRFGEGKTTLPHLSWMGWGKLTLHCYILSSQQHWLTEEHQFRYMVLSLALTLDIGMTKFSLKDNITRVSRTIKMAYAAFSKSVSWTWNVEHGFPSSVCSVNIWYSFFILPIIQNTHHTVTYFCGTEFHPPPYGGVWRWWLEPHRLPVCRLDVLPNGRTQSFTFHSYHHVLHEAGSRTLNFQ